MTENATENYPPNEFVCTKSDAGALVWMERSESKKITDARAAAAAAAAKAAADKAAADKAAADKAAADKAAADKAAADRAAADAAAQAAAAQAAQEAAAQAAAKQAAPAAPSSVYYASCTAARAAGAAPIYRGQPGYRPALDRDNDGIACEK